MDKMDLVDWLIEMQGAVPDGEFASRINLSPSYYSRIRSRKWPLGYGTLGRLVAAFPSRAEEIVRLWLADH